MTTWSDVINKVFSVQKSLYSGGCENLVWDWSAKASTTTELINRLFDKDYVLDKCKELILDDKTIEWGVRQLSVISLSGILSRQTDNAAVSMASAFNANDSLIGFDDDTWLNSVYRSENLRSWNCIAWSASSLSSNFLDFEISNSLSQLCTLQVEAPMSYKKFKAEYLGKVAELSQFGEFASIHFSDKVDGVLNFEEVVGRFVYKIIVKVFQVIVRILAKFKESNFASEEREREQLWPILMAFKNG